MHETHIGSVGLPGIAINVYEVTNDDGSATAYATALLGDYEIWRAPVPCGFANWEMTDHAVEQFAQDLAKVLTS